MLGRELAAALTRAGVLALAGRADLDITDAEAVRRVLSSVRPRVVINAAGYTDVDGAEAEPELADQVNRAGPGNLSRACREIGALLVHYSTDYVFAGDAERPYCAGDTPHPINAYGQTKLAGENEVTESGCRHLLIRTSWLFASHGRNFVRTILDLALQRPTLDVVDDQFGRPTYAPDLAHMTIALLEHEAQGTFHAANDGQCSWYELARAVSESAGLACDIRPCPTSAQPRAARRPAYTVLDLSATAAIIGQPRHWKEAVADCVERLMSRRVIRSP